MSIPKRLAIIMALQEHLAGIAKADGYNYDLFDKVLRGRIVEAPRPDLAVYTGEWSDIRKDHWTLLIQGIVNDDFTANTTDDAYYMAQDVERRLQRLIAVKPGTGAPMFPDEHLLGDKITSVEIAPPVVRPPEAGVSTKSFFYLPVRLGVALKIGE
jgi:hypothetical protein